MPCNGMIILCVSHVSRTYQRLICFLIITIKCYTMAVDDLRNELAVKIKEIPPIEKKLKFQIDGEIMLIDGSGSENVMSAMDEEADCTITMSEDTYLKLQNKQIKPMIATLTGKLKVKGDLALARKLKELM